MILPLAYLHIRRTLNTTTLHNVCWVCADQKLQLIEFCSATISAEYPVVTIDKRMYRIEYTFFHHLFQFVAAPVNLCQFVN